MSLHVHASLPRAEKPAARSLALAAVLSVVAALTPSCAPRERMCAVDDPCSAGLTCVTGRCVPPKGAVRLFEVDDAGAPVVKRRVYAASDVAWVGGAASDLPPGAVPETVGFGAKGGGTLLLRFDGVVPPSDLVEAYVVLRRAQGTDAPAAPVLLEARRIEEPWDSRTLVASRAPRLGDVLTPTTRALPVSGDVVRIDVREIVAALAKRRVNDHGIGIVAEVREGTPLYVALVPARGAQKGPELEIYAR